MIWDRSIETLSRDEMRELQSKRLCDIVAYSYNNVPLYKKKFDKLGLRPEDIKSIEDIEKIPFTTKEDLRDNYPFDLFAVPQKKIVRLHASSGTTGKPIVVGYTKNDMEMWTEAVARLVTAAGGTDDDVAQVLFGYGMFTGGLGLHYGIERVGMTVIPASSGNSERQLMYMQDFSTSVMISTPSYALYLSEIAHEAKIDISKLKLRLGLFGGEGHTPEMRKEIEERWGIVATENYGLSEITGPGVSGECYIQDGMHVNEDFFFPEIVDTDTLKGIELGKKGEVVLTTLTKEGIPMLRYRTKDISILNEKKCDCGRTTVRMNKILGRTDDMLIIRGVNVFPSQIESVLVGMTEIGPHYQIIVRKHEFMDDIEILVEVRSNSIIEKYKELEQLEVKIKHALKNVLQISAKVKLVEPKTLERYVGKAKRVIDLRDQ